MSSAGEEKVFHVFVAWKFCFLDLIVVFIVVCNQFISAVTYVGWLGDRNLVLVSAGAARGAQGSEVSRGSACRLLALHMWAFLENHVDIGEVGRERANHGISGIFFHEWECLSVSLTSSPPHLPSVATMWILDGWLCIHVYPGALISVRPSVEIILDNVTGYKRAR